LHEKVTVKVCIICIKMISIKTELDNVSEGVTTVNKNAWLAINVCKNISQ